MTTREPVLKDTETTEPASLVVHGSVEGCAHEVFVGVPLVCEKEDDGAMVAAVVESELDGDSPVGFPEDPDSGFPEAPEGSSDGFEGEE